MPIVAKKPQIRGCAEFSQRLLLARSGKKRNFRRLLATAFLRQSKGVIQEIENKTNIP
jgi:hypothetical protein